MINTYTILNDKGQEIGTYTAKRSAKFSSALDMIKHYQRNRLQVTIKDDEGGIITQAECEYILK